MQASSISQAPCMHGLSGRAVKPPLRTDAAHVCSAVTALALLPVCLTCTCLASASALVLSFFSSSFSRRISDSRSVDMRRT